MAGDPRRAVRGPGAEGRRRPDRARGAEAGQDAAVVPVTVKALMPQTPSATSGPSTSSSTRTRPRWPACSTCSPQSGNATIGTRIRVNEYTYLHAVAETSDGELYVVERFIKAAGGCSAPGMKDKAAAMARLGKMQFKPMTTFAPGEVKQAQLLISHPNYTGMQMDQLTRHWIPPDYVRLVKVKVGDTPVLEIEGDIAFSEDPAFTFSFTTPAPTPLRCRSRTARGATSSRAGRSAPAPDRQAC